MNIASTFSESSRASKEHLRIKVFTEWHSRSIQHTVAFALLGVFFWGSDWASDPARATWALYFRLGILAVLLLSTVVKRLSKSIYLSAAACYLALAAGEILSVALLGQLRGGPMAGVGQMLYFLLGSLVLCPLYPFVLNAIGCAALALAPMVAGTLLVPGNFPHFPYAFTLWPAAALTVLAHSRIRALLIDNIKLRQEIEAATIIDPVTGLLNLHGLEQAFQRLIKLGQIKPLQQFLLLIEIDGLEQLQVAQEPEFAEALRAKLGQIVDVSFRGRDITASPTPEEFVCILQQVSRERAFDVAERFRTSILSKEFDGLPRVIGGLKLTVSIGIVCADTKEKISSLLNHARVGVAQAKSLGGNQCVCV